MQTANHSLASGVQAPQAGMPRMVQIWSRDRRSAVCNAARAVPNAKALRLISGVLWNNAPQNRQHRRGLNCFLNFDPVQSLDLPGQGIEKMQSQCIHPVIHRGEGRRRSEKTGRHKKKCIPGSPKPSPSHQKHQKKLDVSMFRPLGPRVALGRLQRPEGVFEGWPSVKDSLSRKTSPGTDPGASP